jgi:phenylpropionate dioxygenase-like ring-hydroxylating dioxygenase large terminal subunit
VWNKHYVLWRTVDQSYHAIDNECSHRGASLADGIIVKTDIMCPYHGYKFDTEGTLVHVPGLANFTNTPCQNAPSYHVVEQDGWIYLNTVPKIYFPEVVKSNKTSGWHIYREPEASNKNFTRTLIKAQFENYGRIISENSLDIMHIGFVHSFGNREHPSPYSEVPPHRVNDTLMHYRTQYEYMSGKKSFAKRIFSVNQLKIENEFVLPHTTVARVFFGPFVSTIITAALPVNDTHTILFVKTYRNYWNTLDKSFFGKVYNSLGDRITKKWMTDTVNQDKGIVEGILSEFRDGRFNMKFDKLQNTYRTFYKRFIDPQ